MIEVEKRGVVTILRMVRGKGNALNLELAAALIDALDRLDASAAGAGVLTGQGSIFGAGVDLPALVEGGAGYVHRFLPLLDQACAVGEELAAIPATAFAATKQAVRQPLLKAARHQTALTEAALMEHWCAAETLGYVAAFADQAIERRS
jgi:enoyl-CoA hydratase/carnithine racemase